jgi:hypothetical protein
MLPKSPGLSLHRSEVFHGATRSRDCILLSGVHFIDHSRRYWTANNGNDARFLQVSPFHSPNTLLISAHPLSSRHRRRWARPLAVSYDWQTLAILLPPAAAYHVNTKVGFYFRLRPERWLRNYQNCLATCTSRRRLFPLRCGTTRAATTRFRSRSRLLLAVKANNETQREGPAT